MAYRHFSEMPVWKTAHELVLRVYKLSASFPQAEQFALTSQLRRAIVSVSSNIAEGFGRHHPKDKANFYYHARGSLYEVENQLMIARDVGYISNEQFKELLHPIHETSHDLNKIIKTLTG